MKKLYTLLAASLTVASMSAMVDGKVSLQLPSCDYKFSPEAQMYMNLQTKQMQQDVLAGVERPGSMKKTWIAPNGEVWNAQFLFSGMELGDILVGENPDGTPHEFTIEEAPFYLVPYLLWRYNDEGVPMTQIVQYCIWPTVYMGKQFWDQSLLVQQPDGTYAVPESLRDYAIMDFEEFANAGGDFCKTFTETGAVYPTVNSSQTSVVTWLLVPTKQVQVKSLFNGQEAYTNPATPSRVTINSYDSAEGVASITNQIYMELISNGAKYTIGNAYDGVIRLEGFHPTEYRPDMGELHVFNCGELSSEMLGDDDPYYPESLEDTWGPFQRFYAWGVGENLTVNIKNANAPFSSDNVGISFKNDGAAISENVNYWHGGFYSKPGTGDISNNVWTLQEPEMKQDDYGFYPVIVPVADSFVSGGYNYSFGEFDGVTAWYHEFSYYPVLPSRIVMGSKDGSGLFAIDDFGNKLFMGTKDKVYFHYNAEKVGDVKEITAVGDLDSFENVGVENVIAEANISVSAANGEISVVAGENCDIAVYSLNGGLVKSANVAEGEALNVKVEKGLYIVKAGKNAVKVVL